MNGFRIMNDFGKAFPPNRQLSALTTYIMMSVQG